MSFVAAAFFPLLFLWGGGVGTFLIKILASCVMGLLLGVHHILSVHFESVLRDAARQIFSLILVYCLTVTVILVSMSLSLPQQST